MEPVADGIKVASQAGGLPATTTFLPSEDLIEAICNVIHSIHLAESSYIFLIYVVLLSWYIASFLRVEMLREQTTVDPTSTADADDGLERGYKVIHPNFARAEMFY